MALELYGHERVKALLPRLTAHTLLFVGPERVGRKQAARWYAALLNCEHPGEGAPCGRCASCLAFANHAHPDYREVAPERLTKTGRLSRRPELRIDQLVVREGGDPDPLARWLEQRPRFSRRVGVIDGAEALTSAAANAFLKLLEEPPSYASIILIAPSVEQVLPTIASRAAVVRFGAVAAEALPVTLPGPHPSAALGRPGDLMLAASGPEAFDEAIALLRSYLSSVPKGLEEAFEAADRLEKRVTGEERLDLFDLLRALLREEAPERYAAAVIALERCEEALSLYAAPSTAFQVLTLELREILSSRR
jgi:hypothetical protein